MLYGALHSDDTMAKLLTSDSEWGGASSGMAVAALHG
jgi:hypothetical protein